MCNTVAGAEGKANGLANRETTSIRHDELPFVIEPPSGYEDFKQLVDGRRPEDLSTAIRRIRVINKATLAAQGKKGLQVGHQGSKWRGVSATRGLSNCA